MAPVIPQPKPQPKQTPAASDQFDTKIAETTVAEPVQTEIAPERVSQGELIIPERSIVRQMATRYHMEPKAFQHAVMDTCFPPSNKNERVISAAEFAAFLLIAFEHGLNPIRREIYGFRAKNGAIVPVVGVDGWANIINQHPQMDGLDFDEHFTEGQDPATAVPYAITCRIHRKDRSRPIAVTEYLAECKKDTEPWNKWTRRMLRHKSLIQCSRIAFGFSGIYDPDEAERMGADISGMIEADGMRVVGSSQARLNGGTATSAPRITQQATQEAGGAPAEASGKPAPAGNGPQPTPPAGASPQEGEAKPLEGEVLPPQGGGKAPPPVTNEGAFILWLDAEFSLIKPGQGCADEFSILWDDKIIPRLEDAPPAVVEAADGLQRRHAKRLGLN